MTLIFAAQLGVKHNCLFAFAGYHDILQRPQLTSTHACHGLFANDIPRHVSAPCCQARACADFQKRCAQAGRECKRVKAAHPRSPSCEPADTQAYQQQGAHGRARAPAAASAGGAAQAPRRHRAHATAPLPHQGQGQGCRRRLPRRQRLRAAPRRGGCECRHLRRLPPCACTTEIQQGFAGTRRLTFALALYTNLPISWSAQQW